MIYYFIAKSKLIIKKELCITIIIIDPYFSQEKKDVFLLSDYLLIELLKNNIELAIIHAVILISLSFVIAPALVKIAAEFIPYPKMPF